MSFYAVDEDLFLRRISDAEKKLLRASFGVQEDDVLVVYIGHILPVKGVMELVKATSQIKNPKVKLLVIGSVKSASDITSEYYTSVTRFIEKVPERVKCTGYIANDEVYKFAQIADIQAFPSLWEEAFSLSLLEGIFSCSPIMITKSGGMPEVVNERGAIIVEKDERVIENLATAIEFLANHPERREEMREANRKHSVLFRKRKFYDSFVDVFNPRISKK